MNVRFFNPAKSYLKIKPEIDAEMQDVLTRGDLVLRRDVEQFEENLARYVGTKHAVALASGTDALVLSLTALGILPGDRVLVPSYTFRATLEAVIHAGGVPVPYDLDGPHLADGTWWIPAHLEGKIEPWFDEKVKKAKELGIIIVEDACQAIGAHPVVGATACYSFYPAKILGCYGDGGAIATDNKETADEIRKLRNHYKPDWNKVAFNSRMDNLQAAVLNVKMKYLVENVARRKVIAEKYDAGLKAFPVKLPTPRAVYQDYIIETTDAGAIHDYLQSRGVETMLNEYPFPAFYQKGPKAQEYEKNSLRLPCHTDLEDDEIAFVIESIKAYFDNKVYD